MMVLFKEPNTRFEMYICHVRHNNNIIKYTIVSANTFKIFWLHVSTALRPSSGQHIQIKCLQCAYTMGYYNMYNSGYYTHCSCTQYGIPYCTHIEDI